MLQSESKTIQSNVDHSVGSFTSDRVAGQESMKILEVSFALIFVLNTFTVAHGALIIGSSENHSQRKIRDVDEACIMCQPRPSSTPRCEEPYRWLPRKNKCMRKA